MEKEKKITSNMQIDLDANKMFSITTGECEKVLSTIDENTFHSCITDPPYGMGMDHWDHSVPSISIWKQVYRVLRPGAFCLAFCSPELYHRLACNVEDAGFVIKDQIMWMTTTKMPKFNRLKPAHEPIVVAQKPYQGSLQNNFEKWGCGLINTETTRIPWDKKPPTGWVAQGAKRRTFGKEGKTTGTQKEFGTVDANPDGRYPSNIIGEVLPDHQKYFYAPRATRKEKGENNDHPTVKPISLMEYLIKIYSPPDTIVLDPFCGSGTTGVAAKQIQRRFYGIDMSEHYCEIARERISNLITVI
jgi:site-specific DNA-methyltransferase (adenine-specific)